MRLPKKGVSAIIIIAVVAVLVVSFFAFTMLWRNGTGYRTGPQSGNNSQYGYGNNSQYGSPNGGYQQPGNYQGQVAYAGDGTAINAGSLPDCSGTAFFDTSPLKQGELAGIEPLGHMSGEHVLPFQADHVYFNPKSGAAGQIFAPATVYSPGNITVLQVAQSKSLTGREGSSYVVFFSTCKSVMFAFQMQGVSSKILNAIASETPITCQTGQVANICVYGVSIQFQSGEVMGNISNSNLDFAAADVRTQPLAFINQGIRGGFVGDSYLHAVCPLDYYDSATKSYLYSQLLTKNAGANGIPACGTTMQDISGTAQGDWYEQGSNSNYIDITKALAIVHSNLDPSQGEVSAGSDLIPSTDLGAQMIFAPQSTGQINREPSQITPDGKVYCFQGPAGVGANGNEGHVDIQLVDSATLKADFSSGVCPSTPVLTNPLTYTR